MSLEVQAIVVRTHNHFKFHGFCQISATAIRKLSFDIKYGMERTCMTCVVLSRVPYAFCNPVDLDVYHTAGRAIGWKRH